MRIIKNIYFYATFLFMLCIFFIFNSDFVISNSSELVKFDKKISINNNHVDYIFTTQEVNLSKITDTSISITSKNFNRDFLDSAEKFYSTHGYDVQYDDGQFVISGLIPDFLYNSLCIEAQLSNEQKYILEIKNFKTAKSQDPIKQFITQTLQYTLKKSISPIDFYMWEHKILTKEVTPEEFVLRILEHPQILYKINTPEKFIERMYSAIFLSRMSEYELTNWFNKFNQYKKIYFLTDEQAYNLIAEEMMKSEDFKNRIDILNLDEIEIPSSTRYLDVYENLKIDNNVDNKINDCIYVMDYDELNRTAMTETTATLFLNEGFEDELNSNIKISVNINNATAKYIDGKILIEGLEPNTVYENFIVTYDYNCVEKNIFVNRLKTVRTKQQKLLKSNKVRNNYNVLDELGYSIDEFLGKIYNEDNIYKLTYLRVVFVSLDDEKSGEFLNFVYNLDTTINSDILINKLYHFVFNRIPDELGLKYWVEKFEYYKSYLDNYEEIVEKIIEGMTESYEFNNRFNEAILKNIVKISNESKKLHMM